MSQIPEEAAKEAQRVIEDLKLLKMRLEAERANHDLQRPVKELSLSDFNGLKEISESLQAKMAEYQDGGISFDTSQQKFLIDLRTYNKDVLEYCNDNIARLQEKAISPVEEKETPTPEKTENVTWEVIVDKHNAFKNKVKDVSLDFDSLDLFVSEVNTAQRQLDNFIDKNPSLSREQRNQLVGIGKDYANIKPYLEKEKNFKKMNALMVDAKNDPSKVADIRNEIHKLNSEIPKSLQTVGYMQDLSKMLKELKNLENPALKEEHESFGVKKAETQNISNEEKKQASEALSQLPLGTPAAKSTELAISVSPSDSVSPPTGFKPSEIIKELSTAATKANYTVETKGNSIVVKDPHKASEQLTITPTDKGVKLQGSDEIAVKTLEQWCQTNRWEPKDLKISMSKSDIDNNSDAAWKTLSTYTEKGFHVKDFPINDEKFKNMPNYAEVKQQYDTIKRDVDAKQSSSNQLAGG